jgi:TonB family protein
VSTSIPIWVEERPRGTKRGLVASASMHLLAMFLIFYSPRLHPMPRSIHIDIPEPPLFLGYLGPSHFSKNLDALQPNGLRFYFYRPAQTGSPGASRQPVPVPVQKVTRVVSTHPTHAAAKNPVVLGSTDGALPPLRRDAAQGTGGQGGTASSDLGTDQPIAEPGLQPDVPFSDQFVILRLVKPIYPEYELQHRIAARIVIAVRVTPDGEIDDESVQEARADPADASTHGFELSALEALRQWRVRLPERYRQSEGYWLRVPVEFRPDDQDFTKPLRLSPP